MNKRLVIILLFISLLYGSAACAASFVSLEAFPSAGGDMSSTDYALHGKARGMAYGMHGSGDYRFGDGFMYGAFPIVHFLPIITSISPNSSSNASPVQVRISGMNFLPGASVMLIMAGQQPITGESVVVVSSQSIECTFDIVGKATGKWSVEVINPDGSSSILTDGFSISSPSGKVDIIGKPISYPSPFNPRRGPTTIRYQLTRDAKIGLYMYDIYGTRIWERQYPSGANGGKEGINTVLWEGYNAFSEEVPNGIYVYRIATRDRTLATGKVAVFK